MRRVLLTLALVGMTGTLFNTRAVGGEGETTAAERGASSCFPAP